MALHLDRARLLYEQSRYDLAENELRQELASEPDCTHAHALLALCLSHRKAHDEAEREAKAAIGLAPAYSFAHYALSSVRYQRDDLAGAEEAVQQAIELDPEEAMYLMHLGVIHFERRAWPSALDAAERGLELEPEHPGCLNLRAMALVKLGRKREASATIDGALARDPENSVSHANQGWALLEQGQVDKAMEHFREALRLDPELDWARQGIVEALKARFRLYRWLLYFFLWMSRQSATIQWGVVIGLYFAQNILSTIARSQPRLAPYAWTAFILLFVFAIMTLLASPLCNLLLRLNRFGRLALSREEVVASNWVGGFLLTALLSLSAWLASANDLALFAALYFGLLTLPVAAIFQCPQGLPRRLMAGYTLLVAAIPFMSIAARLAALEFPGPVLFAWGTLLSGWAANLLMMIRVR